MNDIQQRCSEFECKGTAKFHTLQTFHLFFFKKTVFSTIYACFYIIQFAKAGVKGRFVWSETVQTTFITWSSPKSDAQHQRNCQQLPQMCQQPSPHGKSDQA